MEPLTTEISHAEAVRHDALMDKGAALAEGRILLQDAMPAQRLGWFARWQLRRAARCFEQALAINPAGWPSMWMLGKIHQRLGDQARSLEWFAKAHSFQPDHPDVAREASIAALETGQTDAALQFCRAALEASPGNPGLLCNLALAHCLAGDDAEAERCVRGAAESDPSDPVTTAVRLLVQDVAAGKRARPQSLGELRQS